MQYRLGIDVGGTNTDAVILDERDAVFARMQTAHHGGRVLGDHRGGGRGAPGGEGSGRADPPRHAGHHPLHERHRGAPQLVPGGGRAAGRPLRVGHPAADGLAGGHPAAHRGASPYRPGGLRVQRSAAQPAGRAGDQVCTGGVGQGRDRGAGRLGRVLPGEPRAGAARAAAGGGALRAVLPRGPFQRDRQREPAGAGERHDPQCGHLPDRRHGLRLLPGRAAGARHQG